MGYITAYTTLQLTFLAHALVTRLIDQNGQALKCCIHKVTCHLDYVRINDLPHMDNHTQAHGHEVSCVASPFFHRKKGAGYARLTHMCNNAFVQYCS